MKPGPFNIGEAAAASGISAKMIRHYEETGLISKASRSLSGYRLYQEKDIHLLRFIRHARDLGFSIKQIADLLNLWLDQHRSSSKVKAVALSHIVELEEKIRQMQLMKAELERLAHSCQGDHRPDCPILDSLAGQKS
ncbi:HTH-type transcriptional regulator HmrR [Methylophilaceae bacterium]|nr:HTH-type transcriptional regulator HmrR [Methylophilaceae bacterium]